MPMLIDAAPAAMRRNATSHAMSKPAGLGEKERVFSATQSAAASEASATLVEDEPVTRYRPPAIAASSLSRTIA